MSSSSIAYSKLAFYQLPDDVIGKCLALEGNAEKRLQSVSKGCAEVAYLGSAEKVTIYRQDPRLKSIVERFLPSTTAVLTDQEYFLVDSLTREALVIESEELGIPVENSDEVLLRELAQSVEAEKTRNFLIFFNKLREAILDAAEENGIHNDNILPHLEEVQDRPLKEQADFIRAWMASDANQAILQMITWLDLDSSDLTSLPPEIIHCTNLERLYLSNNNPSCYLSDIAA